MKRRSCLLVLVFGLAGGTALAFGVSARGLGSAPLGFGRDIFGVGGATLVKGLLAYGPAIGSAALALAAFVIVNAKLTKGSTKGSLAARALPGCPSCQLSGSLDRFLDGAVLVVAANMRAANNFARAAARTASPTGSVSVSITNVASGS